VSLVSGVKELLENALDAKAKRVEIKLVDFGCGAFEVVDDGLGIPREDCDRVRVLVALYIDMATFSRTLATI